VSATDADEQIGVGSHERVVIDSAKFAARLKAKFG
jgi:predicted thioesterase